MNRKIVFIALPMLGMLLTGCATKTLVVNDACLVWKIIKASRVEADATPPNVARQVVKGNAARREFCKR